MVSIGPYDATAPRDLWSRTLTALEDMNRTPRAIDPYRGTIVLPAETFARLDLRAQHVLQLSREGWLQSSIQSVDGRTLTRWESTPQLRAEQLDLMIELRTRLQSRPTAATPLPPSDSEDSEATAADTATPGSVEGADPDGDEEDDAGGWDPDAFDAEVAEQAEGT